MQDHSSHFAPVRTLTFGLQEAHVRNDMLFVIRSQHRLDRRYIRDIRIQLRFCHERSNKQRMILTSLVG
jgi:hypothetical protein